MRLLTITVDVDPGEVLKLARIVAVALRAPAKAPAAAEPKPAAPTTKAPEPPPVLPRAPKAEPKPTTVPKASGQLPTPTALAAARSVHDIVDGLPAGHVLIVEAATEAGVKAETLRNALARTGARVVLVRGLGPGRPRPAAKREDIAYALQQIPRARKAAS